MSSATRAMPPSGRAIRPDAAARRTKRTHEARHACRHVGTGAVQASSSTGC